MLAVVVGLAMAVSGRAAEEDGGLVRGAGEFQVEYRDGRVFVLGQAPHARDVLEALGWVADFVLSGSELITGPAPEIANVPIEEAISRILAGRAYLLEYEARPGGGSHALKAVKVGEIRHLRPEFSTIDQGRFARWQESQSQNLVGLGSDHHSERTRAVREVDTDNPVGLDLLSAMVSLDPDPRVRAAAVAELVFSDELIVVESLLERLNDPAVSVVLAAIEVLDELWDYSLLPHFEALAHHADAAVRDRAKQAVLRLETVSAQSMGEPSISPGRVASSAPAAEPSSATRERFAQDTDRR